MTPEELEQEFPKSLTERFALGFSIEASAPGKHAFVIVEKFISDPPYQNFVLQRPYTVSTKEWSHHGLYPQDAIRNYDHTNVEAVEKRLQEMEGHTLDKQNFASLDEVEVFLKQMGKSLAEIERLNWENR